LDRNTILFFGKVSTASGIGNKFNRPIFNLFNGEQQARGRNDRMSDLQNMHRVLYAEKFTSDVAGAHIEIIHTK
jgi:hypothetical protein